MRVKLRNGAMSASGSAASGSKIMIPRIVIIIKSVELTVEFALALFTSRRSPHIASNTDAVVVVKISRLE